MSRLKMPQLGVRVGCLEWRAPRIDWVGENGLPLVPSLTPCGPSSSCWVSSFGEMLRVQSCCETPMRWWSWKGMWLNFTGVFFFEKLMRVRIAEQWGQLVKDPECRLGNVDWSLLNAFSQEWCDGNGIMGRCFWCQNAAQVRGSLTGGKNLSGIYPPKLYNSR